LANPAAVHEARALLAELRLADLDGKTSFKATGNVAFFGDEALTRVGGAGGPRICPEVPSVLLPVGIRDD